MKVNFNITDNHALSFQGEYIDLHNNFDFVGYDYNVADREIKLNWRKSSGNWVDKNEILSLVLAHKAVTFLKIIDQDEKRNYDNDCCLGEITFFPSIAREINNSILPQSKPNVGDDILYFFENGSRIRIHCERIDLSVNKDQIINLKITQDESLVLFDFLSRFNLSEHNEIFEDQAEQKPLLIIECQLEKQLMEPLEKNYKDKIIEARKRLRDQE